MTRQLIHGLRGRTSNRARPQALRSLVIERAREPVFSDFGPTLLDEHLSTDPLLGVLSPYTLRSWMIAEGLWKPKRRGTRHRKARRRRAALGEIIQWGSSEHTRRIAIDYLMRWGRAFAFYTDKAGRFGRD